MKTLGNMAFLGHFLFKQSKCWSSLNVTLANVSVQRFNRFFSNQITETSSIDSPLIQEATITQESKVKDSEPRTFEELFKKSAFVSLGNPKGKIVVGTITRVVEDSLYIDFGWKFQCVCPRPSQGSGSYYRGKKVRIVIKELELATKFLGSDVEVTLNEADCFLLGLYTPKSAMDALLSEPVEKVTKKLASAPQGTASPKARNIQSIPPLFALEDLSSEEKEIKNKDKE